MKNIITAEKKLDKMLTESIKITTLTESKSSNFMKGLRVTQFPDKWSMIDILKRYDSEVFEYLWNDLGYKHEYGG